MNPQTPEPASDNLPALLKKLATGSAEKPTAQQLVALDQALAQDGLKDRLQTAMAVLRFDFNAQITAWLAGFSSKATISTYRNHMGKFYAWCDSSKISPLTITRRQAEAFIGSLPGAPVSIRRTVGAVSAWYSWLARGHQGVVNPFFAARSRPAETPLRPILVPTDSEIRAILGALDALDAAAVALMAYRGLRVGALAQLVIRENSFRSFSKSKEVSGVIPPKALAWVEPVLAGGERPFAGVDDTYWRHRISRKLAGLHRRGMVSQSFSPHCFRHYFAITTYSAQPDIEALRQLLEHTSTKVTEHYLATLGLEGPHHEL